MSAGAPVERIEALIAPTLESLGYELWRVQFHGGAGRAVLQVMAEPLPDAEGVVRGMTVDDCAEISRALSAVLDVEDPISGAYALEVSSPGLDRPLLRESHFARFVGYEAKVDLLQAVDGRKRFRGRLLGAADGTVEMETAEGRVRLPLADLDKAKLILTDELLAEAMAANEN